MHVVSGALPQFDRQRRLETFGPGGQFNVPANRKVPVRWP